MVCKLYKGKVLYGQEPPSGESTTTECGVNYQLLAVMLLKQPNGELLVAVDHNQLRTMVSETVDPIDWSHPLPSWAVPPECLVHSINQCSLSGNRTCNRSMRGNHLAYATTQGILRPRALDGVFKVRVRLKTGSSSTELLRLRPSRHNVSHILLENI